MKLFIINQSKLVDDIQAQKVVDAIQIQVTRDFYPLWGIHADLSLVKSIPPNQAYIVLVDNLTKDGDLGWHSENSRPYGKIFIAEDRKYGLDWSVTLSHEVLELLADPTASMTIKGSKIYALEVCDPVEDDNDGYQINGVQVSNFVTRAWFIGPNKVGTQYDYRRLVKQPEVLRPGGYISIKGLFGWKDVFAELMSRNTRHQFKPKELKRRK